MGKLVKKNQWYRSTYWLPKNPKELVAQGISFLSGLAETLKSPEAAQRLVDSIVQKDETTDETSIKIPVDKKEKYLSC